MKVVLLAPTPPPVGGIAMWTVRMMNAKLKHGWQVEVVDEKILGNREFFGDKVKHDYFAEIKRCFNIWSGLWKALGDNDAKVVHACIAANSMPVMRECVSAFLTKLRRRRFIIHFRCTVPNMVRTKLNRLVVKLLCDISDCVMVLNQQSADYISSISKTAVQLIPNFVEGAEVEASHTINEEVKRVLYAGGVIETKGCIDLIEVAKAFPNIEFRLLGNPDSRVKNAAKDVKNVMLLGAQPHEVVHDEMKKADIFAFLSFFSGEGFSNSLAEAMACGLPCLVSDWAANNDMIENKGGFVIPIKNPQAAIDTLRKMLPADVRQRQSAFNINKIKTAYADEVVLAQYVDCYERCLGKNDL